ncbi:MAG TPA: Gfo/Idh/MocA family oxidoreductase [Flavisolibacter sp.]|nr:Gfo/Idh/MocA family oxidoreductase [Flavisolibacter sp.]
MHFLQRLSIFFFILLFSVMGSLNAQKNLRIGIAGLTHTHVHWIFQSAKQGGFEIVGIAESNRELAQRYADQYGFSMDLVYPTLKAMLDQTSPEAVTAFNSIYEHLAVVEACAPRGIHVMVEKPLAVSMEHAKKMEALARKHNIHLLTNYETTWYPTVTATYRFVQEDDNLGAITKMVIHDGHAGPKAIGVNKEFLEWLTDPKLNGGGALPDFGCYGANLASWLLKGEKPLSVTAVTQNLQPLVYPKVEDEATVILEYPARQVIIQASWNWPISRKDMEIYGTKGMLIAKDRQQMICQLTSMKQDTIIQASPLQHPYDDPFRYLAAVIHKAINVSPNDLSALPLNMLVVEILDAARKSAQTGKKIVLNK